ncbi:hypothetical protein [Cellulosilyticum sp. WCF-2]|uniref:hypothetical protein n=1 Tax=Cellulosilyticum sp. WCF-2 TaxID=2497860 RepID=UPI000F8D10AD|nr:hypothetical protein [Cellulosilyticum sp. WCF-2]QEH69141.1 hypothetical protein EKH84_12360 [Cellulosilyticum sp. WCF-2]
MGKREKNGATEAVEQIVLEYFLRVPDVKEPLAKNQKNLLIKALKDEQYMLNERIITKKIELEKQKELEQLKRVYEKECKEKEQLNSFDSMRKILFEGIIVAALVGLAINQATELIFDFKELINQTIKLPVWIITILIIVVIILILICIIGKYFIDKFCELYNLINNKNDC